MPIGVSFFTTRFKQDMHESVYTVTSSDSKEATKRDKYIKISTNKINFDLSSFTLTPSSPLVLDSLVVTVPLSLWNF